MASYPPPTFDAKAQRQALKDQQRAMKDQQRFQRQQMRTQRELTRRRSIVGPVFLVGLGVLFLLVEMGRIRWVSIAGWYARWWPLMLVAAGVVLLLEWAIERGAAERRAADGLPLTPPRRLGGGVIWLLVLMGVFGFAASSARMDMGTRNFRFPMGRLDFVRAMGDPHESDDAINDALAADSSLTIDNPHGDVSVTGSSDDGQMHIAIHKQVYAFNDSDAASKSQKIQVRLIKEGGHTTLRLPYIEDASADLTIEVPRTVGLSVTAENGEVRVSSMHSGVTVVSNHGSVDLSGVTGDVVAHLHSDDATVSAHSITGSVTVDGRMDDINVSDITGAVSLSGNASGKTHLERISGGVKFKTHRTDFQIARLDGEVEFDTGEMLHADQMMGPVVLKTSDRNITLERVQGDVLVGNRNGSVTLTSAAPLGTIDITNKSGSVDVGLPGAAGFVVHANTRHGEVENDFALAKQGTEESPELSGTVGHGGPTVHIQTSDGDVIVRKSSVAPLPPLPPLPPKIVLIGPPAPPAPPGGHTAARAPRAPKAVAPPPAH